MSSHEDIFVDGVHIELSLWDTAGQEEFDRLRTLSYDNTHTIMLCFSVDSRDSLENVEAKWLTEIAENAQGAKLVLVALKCDLRVSDDDDGVDSEPAQQKQERAIIGYKAGLEVARRIQANRYLVAETQSRMLRQTQSRRERGLYGSRKSSTYSPARDSRQK
ncbi:MAG: hypothetical protein Q9219_001096 [cf. Caloplaca sp. 3 TL-2023]